MYFLCKYLNLKLLQPFGHDGEYKRPKFGLTFAYYPKTQIQINVNVV